MGGLPAQQRLEAPELALQLAPAVAAVDRELAVLARQRRVQADAQLRHGGVTHVLAM